MCTLLTIGYSRQETARETRLHYVGLLSYILRCKCQWKTNKSQTQFSLQFVGKPLFTDASIIPGSRGVQFFVVVVAYYIILYVNVYKFDL